MSFPKSTEFNKKMPKQRLYENLSISPAIKRLFIDQISAIYWSNKLSPATMNIAAGSTVVEIEVFRIVLIGENISEAVLKLIDKGIPYHIIFDLEYKDKHRFVAAYKEITENGTCTLSSKYYYSDWADQCNGDLHINGLTMDAVYEGLIRQIAVNDVTPTGDSLKEDIAESERRKKLEAEIARLEKQVRSEKQPKKKFDIYQEIKRLQQHLEQQRGDHHLQ